VAADNIYVTYEARISAKRPRPEELEEEIPEGYSVRKYFR
jgi:hypothetical protein